MRIFHLQAHVEFVKRDLHSFFRCVVVFDFRKDTIPLTIPQTEKPRSVQVEPLATVLDNFCQLGFLVCSLDVAFVTRKKLNHRPIVHQPIALDQLA